jgi:hypothetical protein
MMPTYSFLAVVIVASSCRFVSCEDVSIGQGEWHLIITKQYSGAQCIGLHEENRTGLLIKPFESQNCSTESDCRYLFEWKVMAMLFTASRKSSSTSFKSSIVRRQCLDFSYMQCDGKTPNIQDAHAHYNKALHQMEIFVAPEILNSNDGVLVVESSRFTVTDHTLRATRSWWWRNKALTAKCEGNDHIIGQKGRYRTFPYADSITTHHHIPLLPTPSMRNTNLSPSFRSASAQDFH